jgi:hypothetical protein
LGELVKGMTFNSYLELCDYSGIKFDVHKSLLLSRINKVCSIHLEKNKIIIDNVFGKISDIKYNNYDYLYNLGDVITTKTGKIKITGKIRIYNNRFKGYKYVCLIDGYNGEISEAHLNKGVGCSVCGNKKCLDGFNSIYDTRKDLLRFIQNEDDAHKYTMSSGKKILCKCPDCGQEKMVVINNLSSHGFSCNFCSDHISYPNKFIYSLLSQLNINFIPEQSFPWSKNKKYDIYIPDINCIIENHGAQHYIESGFGKLGGRTLDEEIQNDKLKKIRAYDFGIKNYVIIDCSESNMKYIKNSIMNKSKLPQLLNFSDSDVNWDLCNEYASKAIIKEVCNFWNNNHKNITKTKEHFKMDPHTIIDYLIKGNILGYCDYQKGVNISRKFASLQYNSKPIHNIENNIYFFSKRECESFFKAKFMDSKFSGNMLYKYINSNKKYHNNTFRYVGKRYYNQRKKEYEKYRNVPVVIGDYYLERYIKENE